MMIMVTLYLIHFSHQIILIEEREKYVGGK